MDDTREEVLRRAMHEYIEGTGPDSASPQEHPDENQLAGFAEGTLFEAERGAVEAHLVHCDECRDLVVLLGGEVDASSADSGTTPVRAVPVPSSPMSWRESSILRLAAGFVLLVAGGLLIKSFLAPEETFEAKLVAALEGLSIDQPELFGDLSAIDPQFTERQELRGGGDTPGPPASGPESPEPVGPEGLIIARRPEFRWTGPPSLTRFSLQRLGWSTDGSLEITGAQSPLTLPADVADLSAGGIYSWWLTWGTDESWETSRLVFVVATEEQRAGFEAAEQLSSAHEDPGVGATLLAIYALRHDLNEEALAAASSAVEHLPDEPLTREVLRRARLSLGLPE